MGTALGPRITWGISIFLGRLNYYGAIRRYPGGGVLIAPFGPIFFSLRFLLLFTTHCYRAPSFDSLTYYRPQKLIRISISAGEVFFLRYFRTKDLASLCTIILFYIVGLPCELWEALKT